MTDHDLDTAIATVQSEIDRAEADPALASQDLAEDLRVDLGRLTRERDRRRAAADREAAFARPIVDPSEVALREAEVKAATIVATMNNRIEPTELDRVQAATMARAASERSGQVETSQARQREARCHALYSEMRTDAEILRIVSAEFGVAESTVRADLRVVRAIASSWRDQQSWAARRDQHTTALRTILQKLIDTAENCSGEFSDKDRIMALGEARRVLADVAKVEGFDAPARAITIHGHGVVTGQSGGLADGPGVLSGVSIRAMSRTERDALRTLLGAKGAQAALSGGGDPDATDAELVDEDPEDPTLREGPDPSAAPSY